MTPTRARVSAIMVDCHNPELLMTFWSEILGIEVANTYPDFIFGTPVPGSDIALAFQRVPESKTVKNRLHLDVTHEDPETFITTVESLGGSRLADHAVDGFHWTILADPEGNEFCVTPEH